MGDDKGDTKGYKGSKGDKGDTKGYKGGDANVPLSTATSEVAARCYLLGLARHAGGRAHVATLLPARAVPPERPRHVSRHERDRLAPRPRSLRGAGVALAWFACRTFQFDAHEGHEAHEDDEGMKAMRTMKA